MGSKFVGYAWGLNTQYPFMYTSFATSSVVVSKWWDILIGKLGCFLMRQVSGMDSQSDKSGTRPVGCGPSSSSKGPSMKGMSSI